MEVNIKGNQMNVRLKNIGMLDEAEFKVGDLTLICGENNTGKTYATYSLYGYLDFVGNFVKNWIMLPIRLENYLDSIEVQDCALQINLDVLKKVFHNLSSDFQSSYNNRLVEVFAGKDSDFSDSKFSEDSLLRFLGSIKKENEDSLKKFFSNLKYFEFKSIDDEKITFNYIKSEVFFNNETRNEDRINKAQFLQVLFIYIYQHIHYVKPFILSIERTGASMFYKELDVNKNEIVEKISSSNGKNIEKIVLDVLNRQYSRYPKPVKDNIYFVRELNEAAKRMSFIQKESENNSICKNIIDTLHQIVGGKYIISQEGIEFAPGAKKRITRGKFALQTSSSSVRSLLMLNFYILNVAQKGDILMIDEPELNLHPKNQILMGRLITLLVNSGIKVFITTHSDYIVRELSNCIMLNNLTDEQINKFKKRGFSKEYKLQDSKIKAYLAKNIKGKNTLTSVEVNSRQGIFMGTFDEPIDSQNENQGLIFEEVLRNFDDK